MKFNLSEKREHIDLVSQRGDVEWIYPEEDVKQFIKEILDLLDDDVNEREKYLAEQIKQKAGDKLR